MRKALMHYLSGVINNKMTSFTTREENKEGTLNISKYLRNKLEKKKQCTIR